MDLIEFTKKLNDEYRKDCSVTNLDRPWFGHFMIETEDKRRSYKIGETPDPDSGIIDWRHPLSRVFYKNKPGDHFDIDDYQYDKTGAERYASIAGDILQKTRIEERSRSIFQATVRTKEGKHVIEAKGEDFTVLDAFAARFIATEGLPDIRSLLTEDQYNLITASHAQPVIIQGQAGSGKTTVALYRASWLTYPGGGLSAGSSQQYLNCHVQQGAAKLCRRYA